MSSVDVHIFRESVGRVVRALSDAQIRVQQKGMRAFVEFDRQGRPFSVNLPSIPDNASQDLLNAVQGFLDHEVGHLLFTDFALSSKNMNACRRKRDSIRPALWNIIEDVFVERMMTRRFTGSLVNIDNIRRFLTGKLLKEGYAEQIERGASPGELASYLMPSAVRAAAGHLPFVEFMEDKWDVFGLAGPKIQALGPKLLATKSTAECWELVEELHAIVAPKKEESKDKSESKDSKPKPKPSPKKEEKDEEREDNEQQDESGELEESEDEGEGNDEQEESSQSDEQEESDDAPEQSEDESEQSEQSEDEAEDEADSAANGDNSPGDDEREEEEELDAELPDSGDGDDEDRDEREEEEKENEEEEEDENEEDSGSGNDSGISDEDSDSSDGDGSNMDSSEGDADEDDTEAPPSEEEDDDAGEDDDEDDDAEHDDSGSAFTAFDEPVDLEIDPDMIKPIDDYAAEAIEREISEHLNANPGDYHPYTRDHDYVGPVPIDVEGQSLDRSAVAHAAVENSHVLQGEVERIFKARSASRWNPGQRRGKVNRGGLHRLAIGDDRVFRQKIVAQSKDVAVTLAIDMSGSMWGDKIQNAATAAYMLASVLDRINIPVEVVGFTTINGPGINMDAPAWDKIQSEYSKLYSQQYYSSGHKYSRFCPTALYVLKDFNKRFDDSAKKTLGFLNTMTSLMMNNVDGESVEQAAMRLRPRKEARKILIVMSDGQPAADGDPYMQRAKLRQVIEDVEKSGIEVYGLGLQDKAVLDYYSKCEVIANAAEIPERVLALVQRLLN